MRENQILGPQELPLPRHLSVKIKSNILMIFDMIE